MSCGCLKPKCGQAPAISFTCDNDGRDVEFIDLEEFLPRVTLVAKGVPDDVALEYIRQSCQTLARDSWLLKRTAYIDVQAGVKDYYIESGDNEQVYLIHGINLGKGRCWIGCSTNCFVPLKGYRNEAFTFEPSDKIILSRIPKEDKENQLKVDYLAMPTQNACQVDKLLYDRYHDVVVNGALSNLLFMRQYEFADPQMAMVYEKRLKQGIAQAKIDTMRAFETGVQTLTSGAWI